MGRTEVAVRRLARIDRAGVVADLHVDGVQVSSHRVELGKDPLAVGVEEREPLVLIPVTGTHQPGVATHFADRHACRPQLSDQLDPAEVTFGVATMPRAGPADTQHQAIALVVAQRVPRQAGALGHLGNCQVLRRHAPSLTLGVCSKSKHVAGSSEGGPDLVVEQLGLGRDLPSGDLLVGKPVNLRPRAELHDLIT